MPTRWLNPRLIVRACIFLLLGAVTNVMVAWGCVFWIPATPSTTKSVHTWPRHNSADWPKASAISAATRPGFSREAWYGDNTDEFVARMREVSQAAVNAARNSDDPATSFRLYKDTVDSMGDPRERMPLRSASCDQMAAGWPLLSLYCEHVLVDEVFVSGPSAAGTRRFESTTGWNIPDWIPWRDRRLNVRRRIPLEPLPLELAANTAFYAVFAAGLVMLTNRMRRHLRRRAGRCANCNYDLRATTTGACPECGAAIPPRATT